MEIRLIGQKLVFGKTFFCRKDIFSWLKHLSLEFLPSLPALRVTGGARGPFLEIPGNFTGPKSNIQIEYKE